MAAYFPVGQQDFAEIQDKFLADSKGVVANGADGMAFVTNQKLTLGERKVLTNKVRHHVDLFHLDRVAHVLDKPTMQGVRRQYLVEKWMKSRRELRSFALFEREVTLLIAPMGYGKTELADAWLEGWIHAAIASADAPFPIWVDARDVQGPLESHVCEPRSTLVGLPG